MLQDYCETFEVLEPLAGPDGLGGMQRLWRTVQTFRGALSHTPGYVAGVGGRPTLRGAPTLLHDLTVTLAPPMCIRRRCDGALYRVTSASQEVCSPAFSDMPCAQVALERMVV